MTDTENEAFEAEEPVVPESGRLVVDLEGFEGPLDVLLVLARDQKVDLTRISILELAEQYLRFIAEARRLRLEIAADYLVMAAWLAYLKSRLLLPPPEEEGEAPSGAELAEALQFQLRRLESMRVAGDSLFERPRLDVDVFRRGMPERFPTVRTSVYNDSLYDLLQAYARQQRRARSTTYRVADPVRLYSIEEAVQRLSARLGTVIDWAMLSAFLPDDIADPLSRRSAMAATLGATLELAKAGRIQLRQETPFGPLYLRSRQEDQ